MNHKDLEEHVLRAIDKLFAYDSSLIAQRAAEWSLAHRLAVYLEGELPGWNVDCEYNRQGDGADPKVGEFQKRVRPDIILHHRGRSEPFHNLLAIEIKNCSTKSDQSKVKEYTKPPDSRRTYQYQFGLAVCLGPVLELLWYSEGKEISQPGVVADGHACISALESQGERECNIPVRAGKRARG